MAHNPFVRALKMGQSATTLFHSFEHAFDCMPLVAVVNGLFLPLSLSTLRQVPLRPRRRLSVDDQSGQDTVVSLSSLKTNRAIRRPTRQTKDVQEQALLTDILWADPDPLDMNEDEEGETPSVSSPLQYSSSQTLLHTVETRLRLQVHGASFGRSAEGDGVLGADSGTRTSLQRLPCGLPSHLLHPPHLPRHDEEASR